MIQWLKHFEYNNQNDYACLIKSYNNVEELIRGIGEGR